MDACREQGVEEPTWRWDGGDPSATKVRPKLGTSCYPQRNQLGTSPKQKYRLTEAAIEWKNHQSKN